MRALPFLATLRGRSTCSHSPRCTNVSKLALVSISDSRRKARSDAGWAGAIYHGMLKRQLTPIGIATRDDEAFLDRNSSERGVEYAIQVADRCGLG